MSPNAAVLVVVALLAVGWGTDTYAGKRTVCTITVNSSDEKETLRQRLPGDQYQFVELVEHGRPDWLASACQQGVRCDVLVISGHFDGSTDFYSDQVAASEFLPVVELERASCSRSCPGLFSQLKEVYLFGCNTLNPGAIKRMTSEVGRSLVRAGHSQLDARRLASALDELHGESSRDRMRRIFMNVPVIYGFSSVAPLGPNAANLLGHSLPPGSFPEVGSGRINPRLLSQFAATSMVAVSGMSESDPHAGYRREACEFVDDRSSAAEKLRFVHGVLQRDMAEVRMFLERIEALFAGLSDSERRDPDFAIALEEIARDAAVRERYLRFAEDADQPQVRIRMIELAATLGWLTPTERRAELMRMISGMFERQSVGAAEVDVICALNRDRALDQERHRISVSPAQSDRVPEAAALACLGSVEGRARVLRALTSRDAGEVEVAEVYLAHWPITDVGELRGAVADITRMTDSAAQIRALDILGRHRLSDRQSLEELALMFPTAASLDVQRAIAAVFIRSDYQSLPRLEIAQLMSQSRRKSSGGDDIIDILIRRLQTR